MRSGETKRPSWSNQTAVILGGGHSLTTEQIMHVTAPIKREPPVRVLAVNATAFVFDWWDVAYSGDYLFFKTYEQLRPGRITGRRREWWTCERSAAERWGLNWVKGTNRPGLAHDCINTNGNSGAQAINLAFLFGARRIVLLGFDMKLGPKGERHHHGDHPRPCVQEQLFAEWIHKFGPLAKDLKAAGCDVINCTPGSALDCFPRAELREVLL